MQVTLILQNAFGFIQRGAVLTYLRQGNAPKLGEDLYPRLFGEGIVERNLRRSVMHGERERSLCA